MKSALLALKKDTSRQAFVHYGLLGTLIVLMIISATFPFIDIVA